MLAIMERPGYPWVERPPCTGWHVFRHSHAGLQPYLAGTRTAFVRSVIDNLCAQWRRVLVYALQAIMLVQHGANVCPTHNPLGQQGLTG